uniref:Uncharacterized protein n=1 Tax=Panagrolaimus davidi TaxID=227884 RepID=A0A914PI67_9BILA
MQTRQPRLYIYYKDGDNDSCICYYHHNDDTARCVGCLNYNKERKIFLTNPAEGHGPVVTKEGKCKFGSNEIKEKQFQL